MRSGQAHHARHASAGCSTANMDNEDSNDGPRGCYEAGERGGGF